MATPTLVLTRPMPQGAKMWLLEPRWQIQDFPEGAPTPKAAPTYYLTIFPRKLREKETFGRVGVGRVPCTPPTPDPTMSGLPFHGLIEGKARYASPA